MSVVTIERAKIGKGNSSESVAEVVCARVIPGETLHVREAAAGCHKVITRITLGAHSVGIKNDVDP